MSNPKKDIFGRMYGVRSCAMPDTQKEAEEVLRGGGGVGMTMTGRISGPNPPMQRMPSANYWIQAVKAEKAMATMHENLMSIPGVKWDGADGYDFTEAADYAAIEERIMASLPPEEPKE
jgi:hypothetical protein